MMEETKGAREVWLSCALCHLWCWFGPLNLHCVTNRRQFDHQHVGLIEQAARFWQFARALHLAVKVPEELVRAFWRHTVVIAHRSQLEAGEVPQKGVENFLLLFGVYASPRFHMGFTSKT